MATPLALSLSGTFTQVGAIAAFAALLGTGSDTLVLTVANSTVNVANVETITGSGGTDLVSATTAFASGNLVDLGTGSDTLVLVATGSTLNVANVETITGSTGTDLVSATTSFASGQLVDLGGGTDTLVLVSSGNTTRRKLVNGLAPRSAAASSSDLGMVSSAT